MDAKVESAEALMSHREMEAPREASFRAVARLERLALRSVECEGWSVPDAACSSCYEDDLVLERFGHCCCCAGVGIDHGG